MTWSTPSWHSVENCRKKLHWKDRRAIICKTFQKSKIIFNNFKPGKKQENHGACQGLSQGPPGQTEIVIFPNAEDTLALFDCPTPRICTCFFIFGVVMLCSMTKLKEHSREICYLSPGLVEQGGELDIFIEARIEVRRDDRGARELCQYLAFKLAAMIIISGFCKQCVRLILCSDKESDDVIIHTCHEFTKVWWRPF